jgi:putative MFS transporter
VCAGVVPLLLHTEYGWRSVYFVGLVPLVLIAIARRSLRETERYERVRATSGHVRRPLMAILQTPYRRRILLLAAIWALTYMCTTNGVTFWKEFATSERGLTDGQVGLAITIAALVSMPLVFMSGKLLDLVGRRRGAVIIYTVGVAGVLGSYALHGQWPLTVGLVFGIFGTAAVIHSSTRADKAVPDRAASDAFAWANNLLGRDPTWGRRS